MISIVIPHYGPADRTAALIASLREQFAGEIIVVDDAYPVPLEERQDAHVVRRPVNGGFGSAVNTGLEHVTTSHALILNSDLDIPADFIAAMTRGAERWPEAVLSPAVVDPAGATQWPGRRFPTVAQQVIEWLTPLARFRDTRLLHEAVGHDTAVTEGEDSVVDWVVGAAMLLPVEQVLAVGGFDQRFFMNCEEVDLQRRLRALGMPSVVLGDVTVHHESGGSSDPLRRREWLVRSRFQYARKWGGSMCLRWGLEAASLVNFFVNSMRQLTGRDVSALQRLKEERSLVRGGLR